MELRPYSPDDLAGLVDLQARVDVAWFGAAEHDEDEVRELIDLSLAAVVVTDGDRLIGSAGVDRTGSGLLADPSADAEAVNDLLVGWLTSQAAREVEALNRDDVLCRALERHGWRYEYSAFELRRELEPEWTLPEPVVPSGIALDDAPLDSVRTDALHRLIYVDAAWDAVRGHHARDRDEWHRIFLAERPDSERPLLAWRHGRLVGAVLIHYWSDGTGWVSQLAVARDERGNGLGRALLALALRRMAVGEANALGLSVMADNPNALAMYLDAGLRIDREWCTYEPAGGESAD